MEKLCKVRKHIQSLQAGCEPGGGRAGTRRAFDFAPLPSVLCINIPNVKFQTLVFGREDPGLQKLPSDRSSALKSPSHPEPRGCSHRRGLSQQLSADGWRGFPKKTPHFGWRGAGRAGPLPQVTPQVPGSGSSPYVTAAREPRAESQNCHRSLCKAIFTSLSVARQPRARKLQSRCGNSGLLSGEKEK